MEQENKKLLSIDISARLPYNIKCQFTLKYGDNGHKEGTYLATITTFDGKDWLEVEYNDTNGASGKSWLRDWSCSLDDIKPYLRPMSSMTDEEKKEYYKLCISKFIKAGPGYTYDGWWEYYDTTASIDWATKKMFDYRGLINKGLALEAPKGMYYE